MIFPNRNAPSVDASGYKLMYFAVPVFKSSIVPPVLHIIFVKEGCFVKLLRVAEHKDNPIYEYGSMRPKDFSFRCILFVTWWSPFRKGIRHFNPKGSEAMYYKGNSAIESRTCKGIWKNCTSNATLWLSECSSLV